MSFVEELRKRDPKSTVAYHIEGLLEAIENVQSQVRDLDQSFGRDPTRAADMLVKLEVELYSHLVYHLKELRRPFIALAEAECEHLPDEDSGEAEVDLE